jgi:hypothetical protein
VLAEWIGTPTASAAILFFEQHGITTEKGCIKAGSCWDISVNVYYWFMEISI